MRLIILLLITVFLYGCAGTPKYDPSSYGDEFLCVVKDNGIEDELDAREIKKRQLNCEEILIARYSSLYQGYSDFKLCRIAVDGFLPVVQRAIAEIKQKRQLNCEEMIIAEEKRLAEEKEEREKRLAEEKERLAKEKEEREKRLAEEKEKEIARIASLEDAELCDEALNSDGRWITGSNIARNEVNSRGLEQLTCQHLTGKYTPEMRAKFAKIEHCQELGFTDQTPEMSGCLLQLIQIEKTEELIAETKALKVATESAEAASKAAEAASKAAKVASKDAEAAAIKAKAKQDEVLARVKKAERSASSAASSAGMLSADYYHKKSMCILGTSGSDWVNC